MVKVSTKTVDDATWHQVDINESSHLRIFDTQSQFDWHRDHDDRVIQVLDLTGEWFWQFDNELPKPLSCGDIIYVKSSQWHRLVKPLADNYICLKISSQNGNVE